MLVRKVDEFENLMKNQFDFNRKRKIKIPRPLNKSTNRLRKMIFTPAELFTMK